MPRTEADWRARCPDADCDWHGEAHASREAAWQELCAHLQDHPGLITSAGERPGPPRQA